MRLQIAGSRVQITVGTISFSFFYMQAQPSRTLISSIRIIWIIFYAFGTDQQGPARPQ